MSDLRNRASSHRDSTLREMFGYLAEKGRAASGKSAPKQKGQISCLCGSRLFKSMTQKVRDEIGPEGSTVTFVFSFCCTQCGQTISFIGSKLLRGEHYVSQWLIAPGQSDPSRKNFRALLKEELKLGKEVKR